MTVSARSAARTATPRSTIARSTTARSTTARPVAPRSYQVENGPAARAVIPDPAPLVRPGVPPRRAGDATPSRLARDEPCVDRVSAVVARAVVEVLRGWRPPAQLALWTCPLLQHDLERRAPRRPSGPRLQVTRIRVDQPAPHVAEVCALAYDPGCGRLRVYALRLERRPGSGWTMTRLQAG